MWTRFARALEHRSILEVVALVLLWGGVSLWLALWFAGQIRDWSVMSDELQYVKLATAIADSYSPLPMLHGESISVLNQLYPLLLAPFFGALSPPTAFRAAHVLNVVVMASAAIPAYLLGRRLLPRTWSLAVACLSILIPWMVLTGFLMTEAAAYPVFLWAILGLQRAIASPSWRTDLVAVGALALAVLARTQFAVLVLVLPLAVLGYELGRTLTSSAATHWWRKLLAGAWEAARRHWLLAIVYVAGAVTVAAVAIVGSTSELLGTYSVTVEDGSLLPVDTWSSAVEHLGVVALGCGLVPLLLGGGWMLAAVARPRSDEERALATLCLLTVVLLTIEAASYNVRFGDGVTRDRYLFYVVPLLLVGTAAALSGTPRRNVAIATAAVALVVAAMLTQLPFTVYQGLYVDSPASVLNDVLTEQSGQLGTGAFVALAALLIGAMVALAVLLAPRLPLAVVVFAALLAFQILTLRSAVDRVLTSTGLSGRPLDGPPGLVLDWVDSVLPPDAEAGMVPFPVSSAWDTSAIAWWDVEFWNRSITRNYVATDGNFGYTPFPRRALEINWSTGVVAGTTDEPPYVVAAPGDPRFRLAGAEHASNVGLVVIAVERPYRAVWASRGLETDGWTLRGRPATLRIYHRRRGAELVEVSVPLRAPDGTPALYRIDTGGEARAGPLFAGASRTEVVLICAAAKSPGDVTVTGWSNAHIAGPPLGPEVETTRHVGVLVGPLSIRPTGRDCPGSKR